MSRGDPTVEEITPAAALPIVAFGRSNCGWLKALKNSPRIWTRYRSVTCCSLNSEQSRLTRPGPRRMLRPPSPYVYCRGVAHAEPGTLNDVSNHRVRVGSDS